jgi:transposase
VPAGDSTQVGADVAPSLEGEQDMPIVAEVVDAVIGIDTHRDTHQVELAAPTGAVLARVSIANSEAGFAGLIDWIAEHAPGPELVVGIEGTRSYGIGIARAMLSAGLRVAEVEQPSRKSRRGKGKTDAIDAHHAVLAVLRSDLGHLAEVRADGDREALRLLLNARAEMTQTGTAQANQLHALLLSGNDTDRALTRRVFSKSRLRGLIGRALPVGADRATRIREAEISRLASSLLVLRDALIGNKKTLTEIVQDLAPTLTDRVGIGPVSAAQVLVSYSHPGRVRNDAAFAALAGTAPLPADSGLRSGRHRLNRGGDRALNRAIHTIALTRMRRDERTRDYVTKRRTEGKTNREITRILKRYITRELYRTLAPPRQAVLDNT